MTLLAVIGGWLPAFVAGWLVRGEVERNRRAKEATK